MDPTGPLTTGLSRTVAMPDLTDDRKRLGPRTGDKDDERASELTVTLFGIINPAKPDALHDRRHEKVDGWRKSDYCH